MTDLSAVLAGGLGGVFLLAGAMKLFDRSSVDEMLQQYGQLLRRPAPSIAVVSGLELLAGASTLGFALSGWWVLMLPALVGSAVLSEALIRLLDLGLADGFTCACFGGLSTAKLSPAHLVRAITMGAAALACIGLTVSAGDGANLPVSLWLVGCVLIVVLVLVKQSVMLRRHNRRPFARAL